jgi:DNA-binding NtrC family response regulator
MPNLSGVETFHLLQKIRPDLRAVLMSGYDESEAMESFGADERVLFLQKPFKPSQLEATLRRVLKEQN